MKLLLLLLLPFVSFCQKEKLLIKHGTSILIVAKTDTIWVASDRMATITDKDKMHFQEENKIFQQGEVYYTFSGFNMVKNRFGMIFFPKENIAQIIKKNKTLDRSFLAIYDTIKTALTKVTSLLLKTYPQEIPRYTKSPMFEITMFQILKGKVNFKYQGYSIFGTEANWHIDSSHNFEYNGRDENPDYTNFQPMGRVDSIMSYLQDKPASYLTVVDNLACLINIQAEKDSLFVSKSSDILVLYKKNEVRYKYSGCGIKR